MARLPRRASIFIAYGILASQNINDARHIATAVLNKMDYILSWNFKDMVVRNNLYKEASRLLDLKEVKIIKPDDFLNKK